MRKTAWPRLSGVCMLLAAMAGAARAQEGPGLVVLPSPNPSQPGVEACTATTNFEVEKYLVVHATVEDPFKFIYWRSIKTQFSEMLENKLFTYRRKADALTLIEKRRFTPDAAGSSL